MAHLVFAYQSCLGGPKTRTKKRTEKEEIQPSLMSIVSAQASVKSDQHPEGENGTFNRETHCQKLARHKGNAQ